MAPISGFNARVTINGVAYAVAEWSVDDTAEGLDATNSEGVPGSAAGVPNPVPPPAIYQSRCFGPAVAKVMLKQASFDPLANLFTLPLLLRSQTYVAVAIFVNGLAGGIVHRFPSLLLTSVKHEGNVKQLQPVTLEGESDGSYSLGGV